MAVLIVVALLMMLAAGISSLAARGATTRVPVDDFVVGDLPMVCARSGGPADGLVDIESSESNFQGWWLLLLFLGPVGLIAIALLAAFSPRPPSVAGAVPMTGGALEAHNRAVSFANWAWAVPVGGLVVGGAALALGGPGWISGVGLGALLLGLSGGFLALVSAKAVIRRRSVQVRLAGSGRWVELRNVDPGFAEATNRAVRRRHRAAPPENHPLSR